jgi:glycerol-3-phosphate acyltransferase PlsY
VPFGFLMARLIKGIDLRTIGSGNIGATNAMRVLGKPLGVVAFLLDFAKGFVPAFFIAGWFASGEPVSAWLRVLCGGAAACGHVWPVYLRFRGGKAVATGFGAIMAVDPVVGVVAGATWLVSLKLFRFVGLASMIMGAAFLLASIVRALAGGSGGWALVFGTALLFALILWRHRTNIARMRAGTEPKAGAGGPVRSP